jgi:hypothetical protein
MNRDILALMIRTWGIGLDESRNKAHDIYKNIGRITCPFFADELISFPIKQFEHLLRGKSRRKRPRTQQLIRLRLVEYVQAILTSDASKALVEFRDEYEIERIVNRHGEKVLEKRTARSWAFTALIDSCEVKVVIGQIDGSKKEFLSVMCDKFELHPSD